MAVPLVNLAPNLTVSKFCLGTTTFGEQNSLPESFRLLGGAVEAGINFFDTADMYPVVQRAETQGRSEEYLSRWIRESKTPRNSVVLATKFKAVTDGLHRSLSDSLARSVSIFPCLGKQNMIQRGSFVQFLWRNNWILLRELLIWIRFVGLSNETPYGVMKFVQVAERSTCRPKIVSLQNAYSLFCRIFYSGLAECCHHERISLLAYSPLAMGILSGKYFSHDEGPADAWLNVFRGKYSEGESRYNLSNHIIRAAAMEYVKIAEKYSLHPVSLAIAFVLSRPLIASVIFGANQVMATSGGSRRVQGRAHTRSNRGN